MSLIPTRPLSLLALTIVFIGTVISLTVAAGPSGGSDWVVYPPRALGKQITLEGDAVTISADAAFDKPMTACTDPVVPVVERARFVGEVKVEGMQAPGTAIGALVDVRFFDAKGKRVSLDGAYGEILRSRTEQAWKAFQQSYVVPERAVEAKLCASIRGATAGSVSVRGVQIGSTAGPADGNGNNVLIVVVDTLRSDMLGIYGQKHPLTPNIDRFARQGRQVKKAWTQYTWTTPSFVSFMTSQYARTHGWTYHMGKRSDSVVMLNESFPTLAQTLRDSGYVTVGYYANPRVRGELGMGRGFESWRQLADDKAVDSAIDDLGHWSSDGAANFLYVHLMTTHVPLAPSAEAMAATGLSPSVPEDGVTYWSHSKHRLATEAEHQRNFNEAYEASVWDADRYFGRLLDALEATGEAEHTLVALFADHGEMLGEHGLDGHGSEVFEPLTSVPLVLRTPGRGRGIIEDRVGELIDVAPTVIDYVGLALSRPELWQGQSLLAQGDRRLAVSERDDKIAFTRDGLFKVVQGRESGELRAVFDMVRDEGEEHSLHEAGGKAIDAVVRMADAWRTKIPVGENRGDTLMLSKKDADEEVNALRALGYIE